MNGKQTLLTAWKLPYRSGPSLREAHPCVLHNNPKEFKTIEIHPFNSFERCKAVAQTQTSLLVTTSSPLRRVAINLHPQQVTVELLVERRGKTYLPDAAKAQQVAGQWDVPREEVLRRVDNERQGDLPHDQRHQGQSRTDLRGSGKVRGKGEPMALNLSPLNKQLAKRYWNFKENMK